jgi:hypothetical protein
MKNLDDFLFPLGNMNLLRIRAGSLKYDPTQKLRFQIIVSTWYLGVEYKQRVLINIKNVDQMPTTLIGYFVRKKFIKRM